MSLFLQLLNIPDNNVSLRFVFSWLIRGALYTLPGNVIMFLAYILVLRINKENEMITRLFFGSPSTTAVMFSVTIFGIPFLVYLVIFLMHYKKTVQWRIFFFGALLMQILLALLLTPNFDM